MALKQSVDHRRSVHVPHVDAERRMASCEFPNGFWQKQICDRWDRSHTQKPLRRLRGGFNGVNGIVELTQLLLSEANNLVPKWRQTVFPSRSKSG